MKILVLTGSPHKHGTTALLADKFIEGATEAGHTVTRIDTAFKQVHHCIGCFKCGMGENPCVWKDDMPAIGQAMIDNDMIVYVSPMYYHLMTGALKNVTERVFAFEKQLHDAHKKAVMIVAAGSADDWNFEAIKAWFRNDMRYLEWDIAGEIYAGGFMTAEDIEKSDYPQQAYKLGKQV